MEFHMLDAVIFVLFVICVVTLGMVKSSSKKKADSSEDYFLAGRGLSWWLIGFSLIAANISTEQFVGMSGNAASHVGLAIASYEWMAAITLVVVAFAFLPYFLRAGIYTMPEFLEHRYNGAARTIMALVTILIYVLLVGSVTYSGALTIKTLAGQMGFNQISLLSASVVIAAIAMIYVAAGGLKACAWADLIQGSALIIGGVVIMVFAFIKLGRATEAAQIIDVNTGAVTIQSLTDGQGIFERFWSLNKVRMNMFLPKTDTVLPWTALTLGLWIPNFYYWGLNQYITQRTLGSASLRQGQRGIVFAAFLKLLIPFVIVIPGIIAFNLYSQNMRNEATLDNARVAAKYLKANPATKLFAVEKAPAEATISAWSTDRFLISVYPDQAALTAVKIVNVNVLPITQADYDQSGVPEFTVFKSEDKAWEHVFPALAAEVKGYNDTVEMAAKGANKGTSTEKFIAYKYDTALAQLLGHVLPQGVGLVGFVLAALLGAVVSSLAAMLNAASTIFSMDIYKKLLSPQASQKSIVFLGRACVVVFTVFAVILAPQLGNPKISNSIFTIIQESQGFISPGILSIFAFGLLFRRAPRACGVMGLLTSIVAYGTMKYTWPDIQFLNRMAISFALCLVVMTIMTMARPLAQPIEFKHQTNLDLTSSKGALFVGILVVIITLVLYYLFSPLGLLK